MAKPWFSWDRFQDWCTPTPFTLASAPFRWERIDDGCVHFGAGLFWNGHVYDPADREIIWNGHVYHPVDRKILVLWWFRNRRVAAHVIGKTALDPNDPAPELEFASPPVEVIGARSLTYPGMVEFEGDQLRDYGTEEVTTATSAATLVASSKWREWYYYCPKRLTDKHGRILFGNSDLWGTRWIFLDGFWHLPDPDRLPTKAVGTAVDTAPGPSGDTTNEQGGDLGEMLWEFLDRVGYWARSDRVEFGGGQEAFDDPDGERWPMWVLDGEELADGDAQDILGLFSDAFNRLGVKLRITTPEHPLADGAKGYTLAINNTVIDLYRSDGNMPLVADPWRVCTIEPLRVMNRLLAATATTHRIGVLGPGNNDAIALLLPADILDLIPNAPELTELLDDTEFTIPS